MAALEFTEIKAIIVTAITKGDNFYGYRYTYPDRKIKVMMLNKPTRSLMTPETFVNTTLITKEVVGYDLPVEYFFPPEIGQLGIPYAKIFRDDIKIPDQYVKEVILDTPTIKRYWLAKYVPVPVDMHSKYRNLMVRDDTAFCVTEISKIKYAIVVNLYYKKGLVDSSASYNVLGYGTYGLFYKNTNNQLQINAGSPEELYVSNIDSNYPINLDIANFKSRDTIGDTNIYGTLTYGAKGHLLTYVNFGQDGEDDNTANNVNLTIENGSIVDIDMFGVNARARPGMRFTQYLDLLPYSKNLSSLYKTQPGILHQTSMLESKAIGPFIQELNMIDYQQRFNSFITPQGQREGLVCINNEDDSEIAEWTYWSEGREMKFANYLLHIKQRVANYSQSFSSVTGSSQINQLLNIVASYTDNPFIDLLQYLEKVLKDTDNIMMFKEIKTIIAELNIADKK